MMRRASNKIRKKFYYNRATKTLFKESKPGSGIFNDDKSNSITGCIIRKHIGSLYIDLSLFPAHLYKSYGKEWIPTDGSISWIHVCKGNSWRRYLCYVDIFCDDGDRVRYRIINNDGIISVKAKWAEIGNGEGYARFTKPLENYKLTTSVKLL